MLKTKSRKEPVTPTAARDMPNPGQPRKAMPHRHTTNGHGWRCSVVRGEGEAHTTMLGDVSTGGTLLCGAPGTASACARRDNELGARLEGKVELGKNGRAPTPYDESHATIRAHDGTTPLSATPNICVSHVRCEHVVPTSGAPPRHQNAMTPLQRDTPDTRTTRTHMFIISTACAR